MKNSAKNILTLSLICFISASVLSIVNFVTKDKIISNENSEITSALGEVYPGLKGYKSLNISDFESIPESVNEIYSTDDGGYIIKLTVSGYKPGMVILCGIGSDGAVKGSACISSSETNGAEKSYGTNFIGKTNNEIDSVDTVSGSTKTSNGYKKAIKDAFGAINLINGGSYDERNEEEIALDNALPEAKGKFQTVFLTEKMDGLNALYRAENNSGYVFVFGEKYIGTDNIGNALNEAYSEYSSVIKEYISRMNSSVTIDIDLSLYSGISSVIKGVQKTESGNFIFTLHAEGYDASNKYSETKEPIKIMLSISSDGKIICCKTISENESEGFGKECAKPSYYNSYNQKDKTNYMSVDAISGATITTNAYRNAIAKAFQTFEILSKGEINA